MLFCGVALWSLGTLLAPPAALLGLPALCASRLLVGLGEGVAPSAATALLVQFVPARERARAVSVVWGGLDLGSVVGLLVAPAIISLAGWQSVFTLFALLGFAWCGLWTRYAQPITAAAAAAGARGRGGGRAPGSAAAAAAWIAAWQRDRRAAAPVPWRKFGASPAVWAVVCAHFCFNYGYYTLLAWLPSYFGGALGLDLSVSSTLTLMPYLAMVGMTPFVGPVADALVSRGVTVTRIRKMAQGLALVGPALCMLALALVTPAPSPLPTVRWLPVWMLGIASGGAAPPVTLVVCLMSLAFGLSAWSRAGLFCNHQDLSPRYASLLLGISSTAGALPGFAGVLVRAFNRLCFSRLHSHPNALQAAGMVLDATSSWALALFLPTAAAQIIGAIVYTAFASGEELQL